jgi:hypothetical protein
LACEDCRGPAADCSGATDSAATGGGREPGRAAIAAAAGFPAAVKTLDDFNYDFAKGVKRSQVEELAGLGLVVPSSSVTRFFASRVGLRIT